MRRGDFLFAFRHKHQVHRKLAAGATNRVQRRKERGFGTLLVYRSAADHAFAQIRFVDERGLEWRRRPLRRIDLFHVVHEINADGARGSGVEGGEDAGLAVGGNLGDGVESGVAQHAHGEVAAFLHAALLGGNRRLTNPLLQALHRFVVALFDFFLDGCKVGVVGGENVARQSQ